MLSLQGYAHQKVFTPDGVRDEAAVPSYSRLTVTFPARDDDELSITALNAKESSGLKCMRSMKVLEGTFLGRSYITSSATLTFLNGRLSV